MHNNSNTNDNNNDDNNNNRPSERTLQQHVWNCLPRRIIDKAEQKKHACTHAEAMHMLWG